MRSDYQYPTIIKEIDNSAQRIPSAQLDTGHCVNIAHKQQKRRPES